MIKRPLCLAAVLLLVIQWILVGGFQISEDLKPSPLEQDALDGDEVALQGTVYRREKRPKYQILYLTDNQICLEKETIYESKILVYIKQNYLEQSKLQQERICIGNRISLTGEVSFFEPAANPGNFDQKFYYQKQGIHASVWTDTAEVTDTSVWKVREWLAHVREQWKELLINCLGESYGNQISAILLGDKSELNAEVKELYQKSGIGHILAISGLHMSFLGIGVYQVLRKTGLSFLPAGIIGITFLLLYTMMIGSGVSSQRALVMFIVRVGADMAGRDYDLPTSLALAAGVIVLRQPLYLFDAGFLLSFGALLGIAAVCPVLEMMRGFPKSLAASASIQLVLLPVLLYYYFEIPTYSMLLNLLVIPLMSVVLGAGVLGSILGIFWIGGGTVVLQFSKWILQLYEWTARMTVGLPFGRIVLGQPEKWWMVVYYVVLFGGCAFVWRYQEKNESQAGDVSQNACMEGEDKISISLLGNADSKWYSTIWKSCIVVIYVAIFCLGCTWSHGKPGELKITVIDVGQGDGAYIRTPLGQHYLIDGGSTSVSKAGKYRIEPFLKSQGVGKLDYVFVSHGDDDHINGIAELLENQKLGIQIDTLVLPTEQVLDEKLLGLARLAKEQGTKIVTMQRGQVISDGEMYLTCLAPSEEYHEEIGNAASMVVELKYKKYEMLFTGDLEGTGEQMLLESGSLKDYDVLKVAHHGSKNSTSEAVLDVTVPEVAIISAGKENRYGHPHEETIERLNTVGSRIYCTKECGAVMIVTDGEWMEVDGYRKVKEMG